MISIALKTQEVKNNHILCLYPSDKIHIHCDFTKNNVYPNNCEII